MLLLDVAASQRTGGAAGIPGGGYACTRLV